MAGEYHEFDRSGQASYRTQSTDDSVSHRVNRGRIQGQRPFEFTEMVGEILETQEESDKLNWIRAQSSVDLV